MHPFSCIVSGTSFSGRTSFCIRFLQNIDALYTERKFGVWIDWCYGEKSAVPSRQQLSSNISCNEGVPEEFGDAHGEPCLVILDDLLNDVYSKQVCDLFTRGSHHRNISVIFILQNLFIQDGFCRGISLKSHYLMALKTFRDKSISCT